jgi:hypothetical protein
MFIVTDCWCVLLERVAIEKLDGTTIAERDSVNIAGGFAAAQLTSDYVVANGIHLPTKRRAYTRGSDRRPILEMLMVSIDISEVRFE